MTTKNICIWKKSEAHCDTLEVFWLGFIYTQPHHHHLHNFTSEDGRVQPKCEKYLSAWDLVWEVKNWNKTISLHSFMACYRFCFLRPTLFVPFGKLSRLWLYDSRNSNVFESHSLRCKSHFQFAYQLWFFSVGVLFVIDSECWETQTPKCENGNGNNIFNPTLFIFLHFHCVISFCFCFTVYSIRSDWELMLLLYIELLFYFFFCVISMFSVTLLRL